MKTVILLLALIPVLALGANEGREGNGGDPVALNFQRLANEAVAELHSFSDLKAKIEGADLTAALVGVSIYVVEEPLNAAKAGVNQVSVVMNFPSEKKILINRAAWKKIGDEKLQKALALHEVLGMVGLESTGSYEISRLYLDRISICRACNTKEDAPSSEKSLEQATRFASLSAPKQTKFDTLKSWFDNGTDISFGEIDGSVNVGRCFYPNKPNAPRAVLFFAMEKIRDSSVGPGFPDYSERRMMTLMNKVNTHPASFDKFPRHNGHAHWANWDDIRTVAKNDWNDYSEVSEEGRLTSFGDSSFKGKGEWDYKIEAVKYNGYFVFQGTAIKDIRPKEGGVIPAGTVLVNCYTFRQVFEN